MKWTCENGFATGTKIGTIDRQFVRENVYVCRSKLNIMKRRSGKEEAAPDGLGTKYG